MEANMRKITNKGFTYNIRINTLGITKMIFLYDNGKQYVASKIKKVSFNNHDIERKEFIEYSRKDGSVHRVYRDDLAAITVHTFDSVITQRLKDKVIVDTSTRTQKRSGKGK
jgi:hypothetical protein